MINKSDVVAVVLGGPSLKQIFLALLVVLSPPL